MNMNNKPTSDQLRELIRRCDDYAGDHVLWVTKTGDVELSRIPRGQTGAEFQEAHPDMQVRIGPFLAGNEYVGPDAAKDDEWIMELFDILTREWASVKGKAVVACFDAF